MPRRKIKIFFFLAFDVIQTQSTSKTFSAYHRLSAHIVCKCHPRFENTFCVLSKILFWQFFMLFGESAPGEFKKKNLDFSPWHIHFNVFISVPSQLTPHLSHLKALVKVQGFHQTPSVIPSGRFIHVKAPACKLFFRIALGSFLLHFCQLNYDMRWHEYWSNFQTEFPNFKTGVNEPTGCHNQFNVFLTIVTEAWGSLKLIKMYKIICT